MEKFVNRQTGVILEPSTREAEDNLRKDHRYTSVSESPDNKHVTRNNGRKAKAREREE